MSAFGRYSAIYDLLYRDKDYAAEADYVARTIRSIRPNANGILELGSGTGRHGRLLAARGFDVYGIEQSPDMVAVARAAQAESRGKGAGTFSCTVGNVAAISLDRQFDAVIALFHVISYQVTNDALLATFQVAADHLKPGGIFLFDVWHGPAVLTERPSERVKTVADERYRVERRARPHLDSGRHTVNVRYDIVCEDRQSGEVVRFSEEHLMRYLFRTEIHLLADRCGLRRVLDEEFLTGAAPSENTWGVAYVLQKEAAA